MAEHPRPEVDEGERPQPKALSSKQQKKLSASNRDERSLAELVLALLERPVSGDPEAALPGIRRREEYHATIEHRGRSAPALLGKRASDATSEGTRPPGVQGG